MAELDEPHIQESILFGFHGRSNDAIVINNWILYAGADPGFSGEQSDI